MKTVSKAILGFSALASFAALAMIEPAFSARPQVEGPALTSQGKIATRLPGAAQPATQSEAMARIRMAHGLTGARPDQTAQQIAALDCKGFSWPDVPAECLTPADGASNRRPVRVIARDVSTVSIKPVAATASQPTPRVARN
ncbi:hypothetical protein [Terrarubrum flagellatum]|uniref:hypothetical protein n=1 Tax=Terrirubrum flagellatum TaxID=2895980 RepID=UPI0031455FAA